MRSVLVCSGVISCLVLHQAAAQPPPVPTARNAAVAPEKAPADEPMLTPPSVYFSHEHAATNKLGVGEVFPDMKLPDLAGQPHGLSASYGQQLTIVLVWSDRTAAGHKAYLWLRPRFLRGRSAKALAAIAVNRGDALAVAEAAARDFGEGVLTLRDPDGQLWNQLATRKTPRLYLLDAQGKILWMDIEFCEGTERELNQALDYYLRGEPPAKVQSKAQVEPKAQVELP